MIKVGIPVFEEHLNSSFIHAYSTTSSSRLLKSFSENRECYTSVKKEAQAIIEAVHHRKYYLTR